ncbi:hypothetical protein IRJ41_012710, partial [Triplophysa rosa]
MFLQHWQVQWHQCLPPAQPPAVAETEETEPSEVGSGSSGETFQIEPDMQWESPARMLMAEKGL